MINLFSPCKQNENETEHPSGTSPLLLELSIQRLEYETEMLSSSSRRLQTVYD
jgi:hypothetical protein